MLQFLIIIGVVFIIISGFFIGAWTDGHQQRANFHTETAKERKQRTKIGLYTGAVGLAFLGIAILIYFFIP